MNKMWRYLRVGIVAIAGMLMILAFAGVCYPIKIFDIQLSALLQRLLVDFSLTAVVLLAGLLLMTLLFGRIYCSTLCPLGLYQEMLMFCFRSKTSFQKKRPYKYFLAAAIFGALVGGTAYLVSLTDPYTWVGSAAGGTWFGVILLVLIAVLVWFKGRIFCANICPVGTVLGLFAKHAINQIRLKADDCVACGLCVSKCPTGSIDIQNKTVNNETCVKCFKCLNACKRGGLSYGRMPSETAAFSPVRRKLLVSGAVVAVFALAVKGGIEISKAAAARIKKVILPPGADSPETFVNRCLNCNLCVQNCPMKIISKANEEFPAVHISYSDRFCAYDCNKCSQICPSGAIKRLSLAEKQKLQMGKAVLEEDKCIKCGLCVMKCPRQIIKKQDGGFPQISAEECIGCGVCQSACPVKAITIFAVERQKIL